jgi:uncharacterized protein YpiB (UPF0302 family)
MVSIEEKISFIDSLFLFGAFKSKHFEYFFNIFRKNPELLCKVNFISGVTNIKYNHKFYFNVSNNFFSYENKDKIYFDSDVIYSLEEEIIRDPLNFIHVCIFAHNKHLSDKINEVCINYRLLKELVRDAFFDLVTKEIQIKDILFEIDKSLKNRDRDRFLFFSNKYNEIIRCFED